MENIAHNFVNELKKDFLNAHWSWTGKYNNEDGYIVIWDESDVKDNFEYASPKYKMTEDGIIERIEIPVIEGVIKDSGNNYKIFRFYDRKITVAYWKGSNITSKCVAKMRPDGKYNTLYVNYIKGNIFSI